jgi:uncharacterized protein with ParB-like and HNH nuclease domain
MHTEWYDIETYEQEEDTSIKEYDITSNPNDFNISTLFNLMDNNVIKIPPFQRNYVWDIKRASKLIESIILGLPIPQVFLYERGKNDFLVIDGQQRLLSVYFFIKQRFPTDEGRRSLREYLSGEDTINAAFISDDRYFDNFSLNLPPTIPAEKNKYDALKYETLGEHKRAFDYLRTIRSVVIKQNEPDDDDSSMYEVFNRLNTGGQNLKPQEIRLSLYYSAFYKMLFVINADTRWRKILDQPGQDINFKDIEILVRAFAMLFQHKKYKSPMTKFLNRFSKAGIKFDADLINYLKMLFISFLDSCAGFLHRDFYSSNNKFNISLFEAIFVAACDSAFKEKKLVTGIIARESLEALKNDADFIAVSQSGIASTTSVTTRMHRAQALIKFQ